MSRKLCEVELGFDDRFVFFFSIHCYELLYCLSLFFNFDGADGNLGKVILELEVIFWSQKKGKAKYSLCPKKITYMAHLETPR